MRKMSTMNENLRRSEKELKESSRAATQLSKELSVAEEELRGIVAKRTTAELDVKDWRETIKSGEESLAGIAGQKS
jgi:septal ring factor EnvC (AmiA/AmiB activator)